MRLFLVPGLVFIFAMISCNNDDGGPTIEQERILLNETLNELEGVSESVACVDPDEWRFAPIGSKPCGGPKGYIPYSVSIDTVQFLERLKQYGIDEDRFNAKWGIYSDCAIEPSPVSIACENGKAVLVYSL